MHRGHRHAHLALLVRLDRELCEHLLGRAHSQHNLLLHWRLHNLQLRVLLRSARLSKTRRFRAGGQRPLEIELGCRVPAVRVGHVPQSGRQLGHFIAGFLNDRLSAFSIHFILLRTQVADGE